MKNHFYFIIALFTCSIFISSCGSDEGTEPSSTTDCETRKTQLTSGSGTWMLSKLETPIVGITDNVDILGSVFLGLIGSPEEIVCLKDNTVTFKSDGSFTASEGTTICEGFPESGSGSWSFSEQTGCDSLRLDNGNDSLAFLPVQSIPISSFSETEFVSQISINIDTIFETSFDGFTISVGPILDAKVTFVKQ
ncbi:MAG: hypothetical protein ACI85I_002197 [Arenicella sp.]|jgi:hypothetical protein